MLITREFTFDSAHFLPSYHGKCENIHGHTYRLQVTVKGPVDDEGMVIDFALLKKVVKKQILEKLDHAMINDTIKMASAENIAVWIWNRLADCSEFPEDVHLYEVKLWETPHSFVTYHGS